MKIGILLLGYVLGASMYEIRHLRNTRISLKTEKVQEPLKIIYLSDLHENRFGKKNEVLLSMIEKEQPNLLLLGGDLIIGKGKRVQTEHALAFLKEAVKLCPVVYTYGNHETRVREKEEFQRYEQEVKKLPLILLNNASTQLTLQGNKIGIYGLELASGFYKKKEKLHLQEQIRWGEEDELRILLAHTPNYFDDYAQTHPDVVFSGHNHGGIVRLPWLGGVISTDYKIFPKYSYGLYHKEDCTMVLSAGAGVHTIPFRFCNPSEIMTIEISR